MAAQNIKMLNYLSDNHTLHENLASFLLIGEDIGHVSWSFVNFALSDLAFAIVTLGNLINGF